MNLLGLVLLALFSLANEQQSADIFDLDGKEKLFTFSSQRTFDKQTMRYTATFKNLQGDVVAEESAEVTQGILVKYNVERSPTQEKGVIEVKDGKIHFSYTEKTKTSTAKEKLNDNTLVSAMLIPFLTTHLKELIDNKDVGFRYAVWFRKEVIGFKFSLDKVEGQNVTVKMIPSNLLYRSLVNPIYFTLDKTSQKVISIKGRSLPKIQMDGAWRDFDGLAKYH